MFSTAERPERSNVLVISRQMQSKRLAITASSAESIFGMLMFIAPIPLSDVKFECPRLEVHILKRVRAEKVSVPATSNR